MNVTEISFQIGIVISLISTSMAVLKLSRNNTKNNRETNSFVKREDCHTAMNSIGKIIENSDTALNQRITDLHNKVDTIVMLLKK